MTKPPEGASHPLHFFLFAYLGPGGLLYTAKPSTNQGHLPLRRERGFVKGLAMKRRHERGGLTPVLFSYRFPCNITSHPPR